MINWQTKHGDPTAVKRQILRTVVGSGVHGIAIEGTDDHDEMGVYVDAPEVALGIYESKGHYTARTAREGQRSRAGDTDLSLYSLRKYLALVVTGNPTVLLPLFAPRADVLHCTTMGEHLRSFGPRVLSQQAGRRFLGYLEAQRQRVLGVDRRHTPLRPELIAAHGYDTKYASHALRLGLQGIEVMRTGRLTLPMCDREREAVLRVKRGEVALEQALQQITTVADELEVLLDRKQSPLPERPDIDRINRWLSAAHRSYWERTIR